MTSNKTKTTETYILPNQFEEYSKLGFVVFMAKETDNGTFRAIKVEVLSE